MSLFGRLLPGLIAILAAMPASGESAVNVVSARRTNLYQPTMSSQRLGATDVKHDVVLVLEIAGISIEEFQKIEKEKNYVTAGERRCNPGISSSGTINGKPQIRFGVVVPRDVRKLRLFIGDKPPVDFVAAEKIESSIE